MDSTVIAVDIAKSVFEIAVSDRPGCVKARRRLSRKGFIDFFARREPSVVLIEACGSAHHWARTLRRLGHDPRLVPPHRSSPYRAGNKTDRSDTTALLEAFRNREIHFVPVKDEAHQAMTSLHRLRSAKSSSRTAAINTLRGLLREFGFVIPTGAGTIVTRAGAILGDVESAIPPLLRPALQDLLEEIVELEQRIERIESAIAALGREAPVVANIKSIPGIGPITATAAWASLVDAHRFPSGRMLAASLGLTPREHSSGQRRWLGGITKRGDRYLRMLLIHGARSALRAAAIRKNPDRLALWALECQRRVGHNRAAVALANKMARILWAVWTRAEPYRADHALPA